MSEPLDSSAASGRKHTLFQSIKHSENQVAKSLSGSIIDDIDEIVDADNSTLLHVAANNGNSEMAEHYLNAYDKLASSNPDRYSVENKIKWLMLKDNEGFTCLHYAVFRGNYRLAILFEKHGADIYQINHQGLTVVHIAAQGDSPLLMYYYLNKGLKIGVTDAKGSTPLHWACYSGQENSAYALISWGAELDKQEFTFGMTPLHLAVMSGNGRIVKKLLLKGCDRSIKAFNGKLPLDIARQNEYKNITDMIVDKQGIEELMNIKTPFRKLHKKTLPFYMFLSLFLVNYVLNVSFVVQTTFVKDKNEGLAITFLIIGFVTIIFYIISACWNPGFLKPAQHNEFVHTQSRSMFQILNRFKPQQICFDCKIVKPERSRHCEICDSCVMVYDHHCPWIANCVGANNYWAFFCFLLSMFTFIVYTIIFEIINITNNDWHDHRPLQIIRIICQFLSLLVTLLFILPLTFLIIVQLKNVFQNKTTFERYGFQKNAPVDTSRTSRTSSATQKSSQNQQLRLRLVNATTMSNQAERGTGVNLVLGNEEGEHTESMGNNCWAVFCGNRNNIKYQLAN